ncbi:MAG: NAD(P)(+) transhydrogenase (Re/Si-specific) subunit beta, partial [Actinomycetia bacterium]|nr:NAD(P)(+) transhydrogenase (Re/Si-specific) subunit beta [Actinomycetes bacterium]
MTAQSIASAAYLVAAVAFILSLAGLSKHESSRQGVVYGIIGMTIALAATIGLAVTQKYSGKHIATIAVILLIIAVVIGAAVGLWRAKVVEMTGMPELIALLHSFVGLAAVLVGWNGYLEVEHSGSTDAQRLALHNALGLDAVGRGSSLLAIHHAEVFVGIFIGAVTFTGS